MIQLKTLFILIGTIASFAAKAQGSDTAKNRDIAFVSIKQLPHFPGGDKAFEQYLTKNLKYPQAAKDKNIKGLVIVNFIVERNGSLSNANVLRSPASELNEEALRLINNSPKWMPGMLNNYTVRVQYTVEIKFDPTSN